MGEPEDQRVPDEPLLDPDREREPPGPHEHLGPPEAEMTPPPGRAEPVVVPRWVQLVMLPLGVLGIWSLARAGGTALLIFLVATVIALILNPLVKLVQRPLGAGRLRLPRGLVVFAVYVSFFTAVAGTGVLLVDPISNQVRSFQRDVPSLVDSANRSLASAQGWLDRHGLGVQVKRQGETALTTLQSKVLSGSGSLIAFGQDLLTRVVETGLGLVLVIVISIYMLLYAERIGRVVRSVMPPGDGSPEDDYALRAQKAVSGYVRGQLLFSLIMGLSVGVALWVFGAVGIFPDGKRYALFFGIFFAFMELVPYVGPTLGALPPVLVALFQDPLTAIWVVLLFVAIQQLEGHVVAPQVFGHSLRINPLLVIFALLLGAELYGILGAFIALPLAAVARETLLYLRRHLVLEPWGNTDPVAVVTGGGQVPDGPLAAPCPECGAEPGPGDAFCRSCGVALRPRVPAGG
ncbi:MAG: AI-2E family transporter [Solirubrobacteraceae bacterium]